MRNKLTALRVLSPLLVSFPSRLLGTPCSTSTPEEESFFLWSLQACIPQAIVARRYPDHNIIHDAVCIRSFTSVTETTTSSVVTNPLSMRDLGSLNWLRGASVSYMSYMSYVSYVSYVKSSRRYQVLIPGFPYNLKYNRYAVVYCEHTLTSTG
jgi:hypothetical protein